MFSYKNINNAGGWLAFFIAAFTYITTMEPTASFWDCGEFIAVSYKLMTPHPPGAPLFLLIGRIFSLFASDVTQVAYWINMTSALSSAFTIMFLFWSFTMIARKVLKITDTEPSIGQSIAIIGAGFIASLAYTFSDSFWFSAVEAEVYAMSAFFTAFVFWGILKWETVADEEGSDRWLLLIAYMVGLSIGVHLLNLVAIPAIAFVYYFKKYEPNFKGAMITLAFSSLILLIILVGIIPGLPSVAASFEIFFVNSLGLPFNSGIIFFCLALVGALVYGIYYSNKTDNRVLNVSLLAFAFILIGYCSYGIIIIRSNFNPPIDENNPEDVMKFVSYLKREQYGDRPLFKGPQFTAKRVATEQGDALYRKGDGEYVVYDHKVISKYEPNTLLPRMHSQQARHVKEYSKLLKQYNNGYYKNGRAPTSGENIQYLMDRQLGDMYWRYFLWNFVGRKGDIQNSGVLWPTEASEKIPAIMQSFARNNYYALPLILGILGIIFLFYQDQRSLLILGMLFFFTGVAIILYLNAPPFEPRERDYAYAGSYYAYCFFIGFGVLGIYQLITKYLNNQIVAGALAVLIAIPIPTVMASEGWDDHDRSERYFSVDSAKNLLESCAKNAIIFTGGDNDTFPLWYVQEVEGFRTDVRVCNLSLLNTDWYIDQMRNKYYDSEALPITMESINYMQGTNDVLYYEKKGEKDAPMNLLAYTKAVKAKSPQIRHSQWRPDQKLNKIPSHLLYLNVNVDEAIKNIGTVPEIIKPYAQSRMQWNLGGRSYIDKKDLIILDMIAQINKGNWKRPIYFSTTLSTSNYMNLKDHMVKEGLAYRLLPIKHGQSEGIINTDIMYENMMTKYQFRNMNKTGVFYDENYNRFIYNVRAHFLQLALDLSRQDENEKAKKVIDYCTEQMPDNVIAMDDVANMYVLALYDTDQKEAARKYVNQFLERCKEMIVWGAANRGANIMTTTIDDVASSQFSRTLVNVNKLDRILAGKDKEEYEKHKDFFNKTSKMLSQYYK